MKPELTKEELAARIASAKARLKPALSADEKKDRGERLALQAELESVERALRIEEAQAIRAIRVEENEEIMKAHCPNALFAFMDFDPDTLHPATMEHNGRTCTVHTRFVVRAASGDVVRDMQSHEMAERAGQTNEGLFDRLAHVAQSCIVYPEPVKGPGSVQRYLDIQASFHRIGGVVPGLANEALRLGGMAVAAHQAKS